VNRLIFFNLDEFWYGELDQSRSVDRSPATTLSMTCHVTFIQTRRGWTVDHRAIPLYG